MKRLIFVLTFTFALFPLAHARAAIPCPESDPSACGEPSSEPSEPEE